MAKTFKQFFHENDQVSRLEDLLNVIDSTIATAKKEDDTLDPSHVESLKQQIGELYDQVMQAGRALPDHMQGAPGEPSRHIKTMRTLRDMQLPEATHQQIDEMLQLFSEDDQNKTAPNPFLKPKWAKERDKREADEQKHKVMSAFSRPRRASRKPSRAPNRKPAAKSVAMKESDSKGRHPRDSFGQKWMRSVDELLGRKPQPKRSDVSRDLDIEIGMAPYKNKTPEQQTAYAKRVKDLEDMSKRLDPDHPSQRINLSRIVHGDADAPLFSKSTYKPSSLNKNRGKRLSR